MDKTQAEAIVRAMLEPDLRIQQEIRRKRARNAERLIAQRRHAGLTLAGFAVGIAVGYPIGGFDAAYGLMGAMTGVSVSALIGWMRKRRTG